MRPMFQGIPFSPNTELTQDITATATTIYIANADCLPSAPNIAVIGNEYPTVEVIYYNKKTANSITGCSRAIEGTARAWTAGTLIARNYTNLDHANFIANIEELKNLIDANVLNIENGSGNYSIQTPQNNNTAGSIYCVALGKNNISNNTECFTIGQDNFNTSSGSFVSGIDNTAEFGELNFIAGSENRITQRAANCFITGCNNIISSSVYSNILGANCHTGLDYSTCIGKFNNYLSVSDSLFCIGNGSSETSRSNVFRVSSSAIYGTGAYNTSGADYSEFFEWLDQNPNNDDRVGLFVTLDGNKIKIANSNDNYILGVVSATPSVIGNSYNDQWQGMYLKDKFGRTIFEDVEVPGRYETVGEEKVLIGKAHNERRPKLNPDFDVKQKFIGRENRKEWDAIGMLGVLPVYDDGSCQVNSYCKVADNGIATSSEIGYRVLERIEKNIIKILFK